MRPGDKAAFSAHVSGTPDGIWSPSVTLEVTLEEAQKHQLSVTSPFPGPLVTWEMAVVKWLW